MIDLVRDFVAGLEGRLREMRSAWETCDLNRLRVLGHQLKGAGGSYGYPDFSQLGAQLERAETVAQAEVTEDLLRQFESLLCSAKSGLGNGLAP